MRHPRLTFAALTLAACLVMDTGIGMLRAAKQDVVDASSAVANEPMPVIEPPTIRLAKPTGSVPETAASLAPVRSDMSAMSPVDLPEPLMTRQGLVLASFQEATTACAKQGKRLPSIMEAARWAAGNGALVASVEDAKRLRRDGVANAIYLQRGAQTQTVDFYFDKDRFVYPARRPITNAAIWTSDERMLGGPAKASHYAFSLFGASFSPVPTSSMLAIVCMDKQQ